MINSYSNGHREKSIFKKDLQIITLLKFLDIYQLIEDGDHDHAKQQMELQDENLSNLNKKILQVTLFTQTANISSATKIIDEFDSLKSFDSSEQFTILVKILGLSVFSSNFDKTSEMQVKLDSLIITMSDSDDQFIRYMVSDYYNYQGILSSLKGNNDTSISFYEKALEIEKEGGLFSRQAKILNNWGISLYLLSRITEALAMNYKAMELNKGLNNKRGLAMAYNNISEIYEMKGKFTEALHFGDDAYHLFEKMVHPEFMANNRFNQAHIYSQLGKVSIARKLFLKGLEIEKNNPGNVISHNQALRYFYLIKFEVDQNQIEEAEMYLHQFRELHNLQDLLTETSDLLEIRYLISSALIMNTNERLKDKMQALQLFQQISDHPNSDHFAKSFSLISLVGAFLLELKLSRNQSIHQEIDNYLGKLLTLSSKNNLIPLLIDTKLLQFRNFLYKNQMANAKNSIENALELSIQHGITNKLEVCEALHAQFVNKIAYHNNSKDIDPFTVIDFDLTKTQDLIQTKQLKPLAIVSIDQSGDFHIFKSSIDDVFLKELLTEISIRELEGDLVYSDIKDEYKLICLKSRFPWLLLITENFSNELIIQLKNLHEFMIKTEEIGDRTEELFSLDVIQEYIDDLFSDSNDLPTSNRKEIEIIDSSKLASNLQKIQILLHPVRLSIVSIMFIHFSLSRVELERLVGVKRGVFSNHLIKLLEENLLSSEIIFVEGNPRKHVFITQECISMYDHFKAVISKSI